MDGGWWGNEEGWGMNNKEIIIYIILNSIVQGGGGNFKNRKSIGEIGCFESGMAEWVHWWTERCFEISSLSLFFSDYLPTYLPIF